MIPDPPPIPMPVDNGDSARRFLEAHGIFSCHPPIRASSYGMALSDPFLFYLVYRLGIVPFYKAPGGALSRGSWFHTHLQAAVHPSPARFIHNVVMLRRRELNAAGRALGIMPATLRKFHDHEDRDQQMTKAWATVAVDIPLPTGPTVHEFFAPYTVLACELTLRHTLVLDHLKIPRVCQLDRLLYDPVSNAVYIVDWKTCSEEPRIRLAKAPREMASFHYSHILLSLLRSGDIQQRFSLPADCSFGGFFHVAFQKCPLQFGQNDRPCRFESRTLTRGPRKGQTVTEPVYFGEPSYANFVARNVEWYTRTGRYAGAPHASPPVDISLLGPGLVLDSSPLDIYYSRLKYLHHLSTCDAVPSSFLDNPDSIVSFGSLSPYAPFYNSPVSEWPAIIAQERFVLRHRDDPDVNDPVSPFQDPLDAPEEPLPPPVQEDLPPLEEAGDPLPEA